MFQFLYIFGPAAITFLIVEKLSGKRMTNYFSAAVELIACAAVNAAITSACLMPFGRVELVFNANGIRDIRYGGTAFLFAMILSVVLGVAAAALRKRVDVSLQMKKRKV